MGTKELEDELAFIRQVTTIREWAKSTVAIVIALYEPETREEDLEARVEEVGQIIFEKVVGNRISSTRVVVWDDASLKKLYKRIAEATLRWCIERTLE